MRYYLCLLSMTPRAPRSSLFPYTTLFRSQLGERRCEFDRTVVVGEGGREVAAGAVDPGPLGEVVGVVGVELDQRRIVGERDRKSTRLNSSHVRISYAVFCLKKKNSHNKLV